MTNDDKALVEELMNMKASRHCQVLKALARIRELSAENERLREALGWFLNDSRFVIQVGGNPNVVPQMIAEARARLGEQK